MQRHTGIILKCLSPHKIALLDEQHGRLDGIIIKPQLVGALMQYAIERQRGTASLLQHCTMIDLPFFWGRSDILFWHHVLELCYYFMPVGSQVSHLFELLSFLYTVDKESYWGPHAKKLYLFKLLSTIGIQAEMPNIPLVTLHRLLALSPAQMNAEVLNETSEKVLDAWLRVCIAEHPAIEKFNTIHFLADE